MKGSKYNKGKDKLPRMECVRQNYFLMGRSFENLRTSGMGPSEVERMKRIGNMKKKRRLSLVEETKVGALWENVGEDPQAGETGASND